MAAKYRILDELRYLMRPLMPEERTQLAASLVADGLREPISVWDRGADLVVLDGHNRLEICEEHDIRVRHKKIEAINSIAQAEEWMIRNQLGRRNITPNEKAFFIGLRYHREKGQGARTDLQGGAQVDTAVRLGEEYNVSDRAIRDMGRFYEAVEILEGSIQVKGRILHESLPLSRSEIIWLAEQPDEDHRDLWARALASRKDLQEIMKKRAKTQARPRAAFPARPAPSAAERYDLVELIRIIGANWPVSAVAHLNLDERKIGILADHLDSAIQSLRQLQRMIAIKEEAC